MKTKNAILLSFSAFLTVGGVSAWVGYALLNRNSEYTTRPSTDFADIRPPPAPTSDTSVLPSTPKESRTSAPMTAVVDPADPDYGYYVVGQRGHPMPRTETAPSSGPRPSAPPEEEPPLAPDTIGRRPGAATDASEHFWADSRGAPGVGGLQLPPSASSRSAGASCSEPPSLPRSAASPDRQHGRGSGTMARDDLSLRAERSVIDDLAFTIG